MPLNEIPGIQNFTLANLKWKSHVINLVGLKIFFRMNSTAWGDMWVNIPWKNTKVTVVFSLRSLVLWECSDTAKFIWSGKKVHEKDWYLTMETASSFKICNQSMSGDILISIGNIVNIYIWSRKIPFLLPFLAHLVHQYFLWLPINY